MQAACPLTIVRAVFSLPMSLLTELDSWTSSNYKDASPTGLKNQRIKFATTTNEKKFIEKTKTQPATKPQTTAFTS
jgi:hypothetical protein